MWEAGPVRRTPRDEKLTSRLYDRPRKGYTRAMRWFHLTVVALFLLAILIFAVQNLQEVTISFLGFSANAPLAVLVVVFYLLGMATGGSVFSLLRRSFEGSRRHHDPHAPNQ